MKSILLTAALALSISAPAQAAPVQWETSAGGNGHWYEIIYLGGQISWYQAKASAESKTHLGKTGYLASITSAAEQAFANTVNAAFTAASPFHHGQYVQAWLGGTDAASEGTFTWTTGEAFSYSNFAGGEPNNLGNEDYVQGWWRGDEWNDCRKDCGVYKYLIEYDGETPPAVPLPASLPLLGFALAGFAGVSRKRKKAA